MHELAGPGLGAAADQRLQNDAGARHRVKRASRGYDPFEVESGSDVLHRQSRIDELQVAMEQGRLMVQYQPIVDMRTDETRSVEALVRWRHPSRGLIGPADFIGLAEDCGLISELTLRVIERVLEDAPAWRTPGYPLKCAVNVSMRCLSNPGTVGRLVDTFIRAADVLTLEITESVMADAGAIQALERLQLGGVQCAIDDFGTGYSSIGALKALPVSVLKIDRSLIADIAVDRRDSAMVAAIVQLADALDLTVIAEGIEDELSARLLREAGIAYGQGHYFARPMDSDRLLDWLTAGPYPVPAEGAPRPNGRSDASRATIAHGPSVEA